MDPTRFDCLTRSVTNPVSRRAVLGGLLVATLGLLGRSDAGAKKRKGKKSKGKGKKTRTAATTAGCPAGQKPCGGGCIPSNQCCTNGDCGANAPRCCQGTCLRPTECCTSAECGPGTICQSGSCLCAPGNPPCGDACCTAPPGFTPSRISCVSGGGGPESCSCTYRAKDVCGGGCTSMQRFDFDCDVPDPDLLEMLCAEAGCDSPS
jgi:hypothetical protein